ncbi:hypothetical protein HY090_00610 [Candidatus Kaiserbacteria bacterium]|nr:hypothetical protein [Candidatus Kaiserbacteria bacterium]
MKQLAWIGVIVGSAIGGFIPSLWGGDIFSSVIFTAVGGFAGIWLAYKVGQ